MLLVRVYWHQNSGKSTSTLMPLASLNIRLGALEEHIMASFIVSLATRNTIAVVFLNPYGLQSVSICGVSVHSNITLSIAYEISKLRLLQYWANRNLTHTADWEVIDLTSFKRAQDNTNIRMSHFITKYMSNTLSTMPIIIYSLASNNRRNS